jgi:hypothetical protein
VKNTSYTSGSSDNPGNEYGTICIGPIQIKFGNVTKTSSVNNISSIVYTNSFLTQCVSACGILLVNNAIGINQISNTNLYFNNITGYNILWIAIGF